MDKQVNDPLASEVVATMSHELRSPLTSIKGYTSTLLRHEHRISREERYEFLAAIAAASDHLEHTIDRLLEMSQFESGTMSIDRSPVDVVHLVHEAINAAEYWASTQFPGYFTFRLRPRDAAGTPTQERPLIMADPRHLRNVLDNLLENAINYSPDGGVIDVLVQPVADGPKLRQLLEICICDYGLGIAAEHLNQIFDRFHRVDTGLTRKVNGLGLGLTISKHIIELHDGSIWAESCPAGGSAFHVQLPVDGEKRVSPLSRLREDGKGA